MGAGDWFWALVVIVAGFNGMYTVWAVSLPVHQDWLYYVDLDIPTNISATNSADDVAARLESAGYNVTRDVQFGRTLVTATRAEDPDFRAWFDGLGGERAFVTVDIQCRSAYLRDDCPRNAEQLLRDHMAAVLVASAIPLDARSAHYGDNDFATFGEFFLLIGQIVLARFSIMLVAFAALAKYSDEDRQSRWAPAWAPTDPSRSAIGPPGLTFSAELGREQPPPRSGT